MRPNADVTSAAASVWCVCGTGWSRLAGHTETEREMQRERDCFTLKEMKRPDGGLGEVAFSTKDLK